MSCSLGAAAFQPGSLHESEMMKMLAGPSRAARRGLATSPPTTLSCSLRFGMSASSGISSRRICSLMADHRLAFASHSSVVTRHCLCLPNRHTLGIKKRRKPCVFNKSRDSNRHIRRGHVPASLRSFSPQPNPGTMNFTPPVFSCASFVSCASSPSFASAFSTALRYLPKPGGSSAWNKIARPQPT
jgi:hypothetical protein